MVLVNEKDGFRSCRPSIRYRRAVEVDGNGSAMNSRAGYRVQNWVQRCRRLCSGYGEAQLACSGTGDSCAKGNRCSPRLPLPAAPR